VPFVLGEQSRLEPALAVAWDADGELAALGAKGLVAVVVAHYSKSPAHVLAITFALV